MEADRISPLVYFRQTYTDKELIIFSLILTLTKCGRLAELNKHCSSEGKNSFHFISNPNLQ